jgi:hypothetical protein
MMKRLMCALVPAALLLVSGVGCDDDSGSTSGPATTYTVSGMFIKSGVADGVHGYAKLVAWGAAETAPPVYFAVTAPFSGGTAAYSLSGVAAGSYYGYAFIDVNGDAVGGGTSMPDAGDWATDGAGEVVISRDTTYNIPEDAWVAFQ